MRWLLRDEEVEKLEVDMKASSTSKVFNNLFLVLNSSINFSIYCAVRKNLSSLGAATSTPLQLCDEDDEEMEVDLNASNTSQVINHLFLVLKLSIKFTINCAVRKSVRHTILSILRCDYVDAAAA
jgi:hypothetical protein